MKQRGGLEGVFRLVGVLSCPNSGFRSLNDAPLSQVTFLLLNSGIDLGNNDLVAAGSRQIGLGSLYFFIERLNGRGTHPIARPQGLAACVWGPKGSHSGQVSRFFSLPFLLSLSSLAGLPSPTLFS